MTPTAALITAAVVSVAGGALGAVESISSSRRQADIENANARLMEQNAQIARDKAAFEEQQKRRESLLLKGKQRAQFAKAGIKMEGSALDVLEETVMQEELAALSIRAGGANQASSFEHQANIRRQAASATRSSGLFSAGSSLLSGIGGAVNVGVSGYANGIIGGP